MTSKRRREHAAFPPLGTRIRGRQRGCETVWTLDRFAEVIRDEVSRGIDRAWPPDRIRTWIRTAYELDAQSMAHAAKAIDSVLGMFGFAVPDVDDEPPHRSPSADAAHARQASPRAKTSSARAR